MEIKKINVYLDDLRDCPEDFYVARDFYKAVQLIENNKVDILSLDHDLGCDEQGSLLKTGYDFVKWFCLAGYKVDRIYIHTDNPVGRDNMYETLLGAQRRGIISKNIQIYNYAYVKNKYSGEGEF